MSHKSTDTQQPSLGELVSRISEHVTALVHGEINLAKAKGKRMAARMGLGVGLLVVAAVLALYALGFLLAAAARLLALALPLWAGQLIVAAVLLVIVAILAVVGVKRLQAGTQDIPDTPARLSEDLAVARQAVRSGLDKGARS